MRILVIEDNHRLNSFLASSLAYEGYSVDHRFQEKGTQQLEISHRAIGQQWLYTGNDTGETWLA